MEINQVTIKYTKNMLHALVTVFWERNTCFKNVVHFALQKPRQK